MAENDRSVCSRVRDHCVIAVTDNDNKHHGRRDLARRGCGRLPLMRIRRQASKETERYDIENTPPLAERCVTGRRHCYVDREGGGIDPRQKEN